MIKEIAVKIANTNAVESFDVNLNSVSDATKFVKKHYTKKNKNAIISKPYPDGEEVIYKVEYP